MPSAGAISFVNTNNSIEVEDAHRALEEGATYNNSSRRIKQLGIRCQRGPPAESSGSKVISQQFGSRLLLLCLCSRGIAAPASMALAYLFCDLISAARGAAAATAAPFSRASAVA